MFCNPPPPPLLLPGGKRDLIWHHDWPLKKAIVCLQIKMKGNWKLTSCNSLSLLGTQKKDMVMGVGRVGAHSNWNRAVLLSLPPVCFCHQGFLIKSFLQLFVTDITLRTAVNSICRYVGQLCRVVRICGMRPCLYGEKLSRKKGNVGKSGSPRVACVLE